MISLFFVGLALSLALVPLCRLAGLRLGCVAQPRGDRWHSTPTPLLGGVAIALAVAATLGLFVDLRDQLVFLSCAAGICLLGLADDWLTLKPSTKLVGQLAVASLFLFSGYRIGWTESVTLDGLLTILWVVGITNAFNLLDNMDGLCAGIAVIAATMFVVDLLPAAMTAQQLFEAKYMSVLAGALAGFLVFNFNPASIFLGDSGSLLIGVSLAAVTLETPGKAGGPSSLLSIIAGPVLVLLVPILDTTLVTVSRILSGRSAAMGGRDHSSHRLVAMGLSERAAVAVLWVLAVLAGGVGLALKHLHDDWWGPFALTFLLGTVLFMVHLARVRVYQDDDADPTRRGTLTPLVVEFVQRRRVAEVILDFCLVAISYYGAYRLRFDSGGFAANFYSFQQSWPVVLAVQMIALFVVGAYRGVWRYFGLADAVVLAKGIVLGAIASQLLMLYLYRFEGFSRAVFIIYGAVLMLALVGSRASFRLFGEFLYRRRGTGDRLVIYGAGDAGAMFARDMLIGSDRNVRLIGFIDDDPNKQRARVQGYPILGAFDHLVALISSGDVDAVVISVSSLLANRRLTLETLCAKHGVALSQLQFELHSLVSRGPRPVPKPDAPSLKRKGAAAD